MCMPYGIKIYPDNTIECFNREYMPIGISKETNFDAFKKMNLNGLYTRIKLESPIPEELLLKLAHRKEVRDMGDHRRLWLYGDETIPYDMWDKPNAKLEKEYYAKLQILGRLSNPRV